MVELEKENNNQKNFNQNQNQNLKKKKKRLKDLEKRLEFLENSTKDKEQFLAELIQIMNEEKEKNNIFAVIINCRKIVEIAEELNNRLLFIKYKTILSKFEEKLNQQHIKEDEENLLVHQQIADLKNIINIEKDIAPYSEEISINSLIGDFNEDLINMNDLANQVLQKNAVEIKESVQNKTIIKYKSSKAREFHKDIDVLLEFKNDSDKCINFNNNDNNDNNDKNNKNEKNDKISSNGTISPEFIVKNQIKNFSRDPIEEAFIQDIIPYNYEISEVKINGEKTNIEINQRMMKNGLEYSWYIPQWDENKPIELKYNLKPRISRTIVLPLKKKLKVIKTHSSLHQRNENTIDDIEFLIKKPVDKKRKKTKSKKITKNQEKKEIVETFLKFKNSYENQLNDVILEDIIPIFYTYEVEEQKIGDFPSIKESSESFVKWKLDEISLEDSSTHDYLLIGLNKLEKLKINASKILEREPKDVFFLKRKNLKIQQKKAKEFLEKFNLL